MYIMHCFPVCYLFMGGMHCQVSLGHASPISFACGVAQPADTGHLYLSGVWI